MLTANSTANNLRWYRTTTTRIKANGFACGGPWFYPFPRGRINCWEKEASSETVRVLYQWPERAGPFTSTVSPVNDMLRITKFVSISDWKMWSSGSLMRVNIESKLTIVTILMGHKCKFCVDSKANWEKQNTSNNKKKKRVV